MTAPNPPSFPAEIRRKRGLRRRVWRAAQWSLALLVLAGGVMAGVGLFVLERPMAAPIWLQDRIEARINAVVPDTAVDLGTITFELRPSLDVTVSIDDVTLASSDARPLLRLSELQATLARRGLLRAALEAKDISASGLFLTVERGVDGRFDLAFGGDVAQTAPDFRALLAQIDLAMENPQLDSLRQVSLDAVTLEYRDRQADQTWLIDGGRLSAVRQAAAIVVRGDLALLTGGADVATLAVTATSPLGSQALSLGVALDNMPAADIASQSPALAWLGVLRAPISGALRVEIEEDGALAPLNATLQIGEGVLQPSEATRPIPFDNARSYFTYDAEAARFDFTELSVTSDWLTATGSGTAVLDVDAATGLSGLTGQINIEALQANPGGVFADGSRRLEALRADLRLNLNPFHLRVGALTAQAGDLRLVGQAEVRTDAAGWHVSAFAEAPRAEPHQILAYWPEDRVAKTRDWIDRNVTSGVFDGLQAHLTVAQGQRPTIYLGADIERAELRVMRGFPRLTLSSGRLTLEGRDLVIVADRALIDPGRGGALDASGTRFRLGDTRARPGAAEVLVKTTGSLEATLALLDAPPLGLLQKAGRSVDLADGEAQLTIDLDFPLVPRLQISDVAYRAAGVIRDVRSEQIVPNRVLTADQLAVSVTPDLLEISGAGRVSNVPFKGVWSAPLSGPRETRLSELQATVTLSEANLAAFGITLPPGALSGEGWGALSVAFASGAPPDFLLTSQLDGLGLSVPALNWRLGQSTQGRFEISGTLGPTPRVEQIALTAPGLQAAGRLILTSGGTLQQAVLDRVQVGQWLDAGVRLTPRGPGRPPAVTLQGGAVDLRAAPLGQARPQPRAGQESTPLELNAMSLRINDTLRLDGLRGSLTVGAGLSGRATAQVNGGAPIELRAREGGGFDIRAEDAGAVLRDAQIFADMSGGRFALDLRPTDQAGSYDGRLSIDQVRIRNASAAAALLNAISVVGLLDELTGQGIYFEEIDAVFRLGQGALTIMESSAVGPSMGLSLDGYYDLANRVLDLQGVVSPFYAVNIVGRVFARRGEGLIGISFTMRGSADAPQVSVNPFSALTPGMFREIFRRPPPSFDE